jgi:hypothetical protein
MKNDAPFQKMRQNRKKKPIPKIAPSLGWAYEAIAKLGGWSSTKKIGEASCWFRLQKRALG